MTQRYEVIGPWDSESQFGEYLVQSAQIRDKRTGATYAEGAFRVVLTTTGKPAKTGKGGTVPFYGEMAWADAERLANDLHLKEMFGR